MKAGFLRLTMLMLTGTLLLLPAACGTTAPTRFYLLSSMADTGHSSRAAGGKGISIALAPVELPAHLNRPQMVTRQKGHQVRVDEFNRWAEPLEAHVTVILAENLSQLLNTEGVIVSNRQRHMDFDYRLAVTFFRFDGWPGKEAVLDCRWHLQKGGATEGARAERFSTTQPLADNDYANLVAALSQMLADLSREIALAINDE